MGEWSAWTHLDPKDCAVEQGNAIREVANIILKLKIKHYKVILKTVQISTVFKASLGSPLKRSMYLVSVLETTAVRTESLVWGD